MKFARKLQRAIEGGLCCLGIAILPFIPRKAIIWLARKLGHLTFHLARKQRKQAVANIKLVFGSVISNEEINQLVRSSFQNMCLTMLDSFWFSFATEERLKKWVVIEESCKKYILENPAIFVSGHFGNWEVLGLAVAIFSGEYTAVAAPLRNALINSIVNRIRQKKNQKIVQIHGAVNEMRRVLANGGRVGLLVDQNTLPENGGLFVKFFGLDVPVTRAIAVLAARFNVPVVVLHCIANQYGLYVLKAMSPFRIPYGKDYIMKGTEEVMKRLEILIKSAPDQWLWAYKRWKYVPENASVEKYPFYAKPYLPS